MSEHVVFPGEILAAHRTRVHLDVHLVRRHVMAAKITDVRVHSVAHGAPVQVVFFSDAKVARRLVRIRDLFRIVDVSAHGAVVLGIVHDHFVVHKLVYVHHDSL